MNSDCDICEGTGYEDCRVCRGCGEGMVDGTACNRRRGTGQTRCKCVLEPDDYEDHFAELAEMAKEIESLKAKLESKKWEVQVLDGEIKRLKDKDGIPVPALAGSILPLFL